MKPFFFGLFMISSLSSAFAAETWIQPDVFDGQDEAQYPFLRGISNDPGKYRCIETSAWKKSSDHDLRQIYLQSQEFGRSFTTSKKCIDAYLAQESVGHHAACEPSGQKWGYDYIEKKCVPVSTECGPGIRLRLEGKPHRVFLKTYEAKAACDKAKR